jgi:hypothetical protein
MYRVQLSVQGLVLSTSWVTELQSVASDTNHYIADFANPLFGFLYGPQVSLLLS